MPSRELQLIALSALVRDEQSGVKEFRKYTQKLRNSASFEV